MDNRGECLFVANCMAKNLTVSRPFTAAKYDFIIDNGLGLVKIQVKSAHQWKSQKHRECWNFNTKTLVSSEVVAYSPAHIDFLALHCIELGTWYIIPADEIGGRKAIYIYPTTGKGLYEDFRERWGLLTTFCPKALQQ